MSLKAGSAARILEPKPGGRPDGASCATRVGHTDLVLTAGLVRDFFDVFHRPGGFVP